MITDTNRLNFLLASGAFKSREEIDGLMVSVAADEAHAPVEAHIGDEPRPPIRYCVRCQMPIDPKRVMRGSAFCGTPCRREDSKERRAYRASKACRLCGRPARARPTQKAPGDLCDGSTQTKSLFQQTAGEPE